MNTQALHYVFGQGGTLDDDEDDDDCDDDDDDDDDEDDGDDDFDFAGVFAPRSGFALSLPPRCRENQTGNSSR